MADSDHESVLDPVLVRLHALAKRDGLSRAAVAKRLGVSRAAVAGWFLALEAVVKGEGMPASGRTFRFTKQKPHVQTAIAELLGQAEDLLRAESLTGGDVESTGAPPGTRSADSSAEVLDVGSLLGDLAVGRTRSAALAHRVADVVAGVPNVATTVLIKEPRGSDRVEPYQYQLVVFAESLQEGKTQYQRQEVYEDDLSEAILSALRDAGLPVNWEHGVQSPRIKIVVDDEVQGVGVDQQVQGFRLGSLVIPHIAASRGPDTGLLFRPGFGSGAVTQGQQLRQATLVTLPYGGSDPVGGLLANGLGAGHLRGIDVVRAFSDARAKRRGADRRALVSAETWVDAGFSVQQALHFLQAGRVPGAWLMSIEVQPPDVYQPLLDTLVSLESPVLLVHLGDGWGRMAAWRLAAARLNDDGRERMLRKPWSSDWIDFDSVANSGDRDVLRRQFELAEEIREELSHGDELLKGVAERRHERPTLSVTLGDFADDGSSISFASEGYEVVKGKDRFRDKVVFHDFVDGFMNEWVAAAVSLLDQLATLAGRDPAEMADQLVPGVLKRALMSRRAAASKVQ